MKMMLLGKNEKSNRKTWYFSTISLPLIGPFEGSKYWEYTVISQIKDILKTLDDFKNKQKSV